MGLFDRLKSKTKSDIANTSNSSEPKISPALQNVVTFIENAGGCIITKSILAGETQLKWLFREASVNPVDNGWRAFGDGDTQEYINDTENHIVVDFNTLANLEPLVLEVYNSQVGTDLEFHCDSTGRYFTDNHMGSVQNE